MHASRKRFCLTGNWIYLFQNYLYARNISKTLKGIEKIQFVSELTILLNL